MALSAPRNTPSRNGKVFSFPVAASTTIFQGALCQLDAAGNLIPASAGSDHVGGFRALETVANSGDAAAVNCQVEAGTFCFVNGDSITKAQIGDAAYGYSDDTVKKTASGLSVVGKIVDVSSDGVWVCTEPTQTVVSGGLLAANNLSDVTAATAATNLGLGTTNDVTHKSLMVSDTLSAAGAVTGLKKVSTIADNNLSVASTDGGIVILAGANNDVVSLPNAATANKGCVVIVINMAADDQAKVSISPDASDKIIGTVAAVSSSGAAGKDWINTKSGANQGDYTTLVSNGVDSWIIIGGVGVWASESE